MAAPQEVGDQLIYEFYDLANERIRIVEKEIK